MPPSTYTYNTEWYRRHGEILINIPFSKTRTGKKKKKNKNRRHKSVVYRNSQIHLANVPHPLSRAESFLGQISLNVLADIYAVILPSESSYLFQLTQPWFASDVAAENPKSLKDMVCRKEGLNSCKRLL